MRALKALIDCFNLPCCHLSRSMAAKIKLSCSELPIHKYQEGSDSSPHMLCYSACRGMVEHQIMRL